MQHFYVNIQRDPRYHQVQTLHEAAGPSRFFADWRMAFVAAEEEEFFWLLACFEARPPRLVRPQVPIADPHLLTLLAVSQSGGVRRIT